MRVIECFYYPEPTAFVPVDGNRVHNHRLSGEQAKLETRWHLCQLHRFGRGERELQFVVWADRILRIFRHLRLAVFQRWYL